MNKYNILIIFFGFTFFLLATFLRFWHLNQIPVAVYHDEMDYVITGEALVRFGTDLSGTWKPWQLRPLQTLNYTAELPAVFHAATQKIFGLGPQNGHTPAAIFGLGTVILIGWLVYSLTKNKTLSILATLTLAINPWHVYISRMGYESAISLFFQVLFITCVWHSLQKFVIKKSVFYRSLCLMGIIFSLTLGYFTYHATKFTLIFIAAGAALWILSQKSTFKWKAAVSVTIFATLGVLAAHTMYLNQIGAFGERQTELIFSSDYLSSTVNLERRQSLYLPGSKLFINKGTILTTEFIKHYTAVFDIYRIFISGYEGGFQFSLAVHGYFYLSSIPFILIGAVWWWKKYRSAAIFIFAILVTSPMASAITIGYQSIFRSALTYTFLTVLVAGGVYALLQWLKQKPFSQISYVIIGIWLCSETAWFAGRYFGRYPLTSADNHYFYEKILAGYVSRAPRPLLVVTNPDPYSRARATIAYTGLMGNLTADERKQFASPNQSTFNLGNITVTGNCPNLIQTQGLTQIIEANKFAECGYAQYLATASAQLATPSHTLLLTGLGSPIDSRTYFYLLNDRVCNTNELKGYINTNRLADFNPVELNDQQFCEAWGKTDQVNY